jgi:hypothetical protein
MNMQKLQKAWSAVSNWWARQPKQKWIALAFVVILLAIAANKVSADTFFIRGGNDLIVQCNTNPNDDGIHVCAAAHSGQRGYCMAIPEGQWTEEGGDWYCTGNQSGNKTYDKALKIKALIDAGASLQEVDDATTAWDQKYPPQATTGM